jgi:short-subunit dehydrogenase involved in D-alanine esterification of teichoic acids
LGALISAKICSTANEQKESHVIRIAATTAFLCLATSASQAQYKCTAPDGGVTFQQAPCSGTTKQTALKVINVAPPDPVSTATDSPDQRLLAAMTKDRQTRELKYQIQQTEDAVSSRNSRMNTEIEALRNQKLRASNNLAGATWEQSISTEMQAVTQKYKALNDSDIDRLKQLRAELAAVTGKP